MAHLDIAPPAPPKFYNKKFKKNDGVADKTTEVSSIKAIKPKKEVSKVIPKVIVSKPKKTTEKLPPIPDFESNLSSESEDKLLEELETNSPKPVGDEIEPSNKKGKGFLGLFSKKRKKVLSLSEDDLDLDKIRAQYNVPADKSNSVSKKNHKVNWLGDNDDLSSSVDSTGWADEDPDKLVVKSVSNKDSKKPTKRVSEVDVSKIPSKKSIYKTKKPSSYKKVRRGPVNHAIQKYFDQVEKEQRFIERELKAIVRDPSKALKKTPNNYMIHHNEKLVKSMKQLLATVKSIEKVKFERSVRDNKRDFEKWVKKILDLEKKAENNRNILMQKKMIELFSVYRDGLLKDLEDKKYDLSDQQGVLDKREKVAKAYDDKLKEINQKIEFAKKELKAEKKAIKTTVDEKIKKAIPGITKKERASLGRTEGRLKRLVDEYTEKQEELKNEFEAFEANKMEAKRLLDSAEPLRKYEDKLIRKEKKLITDIEKLKAKDDILKSQVKDLEIKDKNLLKREHKLEREIKRLTTSEEQLISKKKELKVQIHDFELRKKQYNLREKEIREMEHYITDERKDLLSLKDDVEIRREQVEHQLFETKEIQHHIIKAEERMVENNQDIKSKFSQYLLSDDDSDLLPPSIPEAEELEEFMSRVSQCKELIKSNKIVDAKKVYSEVRMDFINKKGISLSAKRKVHNELREIYDDIFLAMIANNNF